MDDIFRYDFWRREMDAYIANLKKEEEEKKQAEVKQAESSKEEDDDDEKGTFEYNNGI